MHDHILYSLGYIKSGGVIAAGLIFYAFGSLSGLLLLLACAAVNYLFGLWLLRAKEGGKAVRDSMGAHLAEVADDPSAPDIRYFLVNGTTLRQNNAFNEWVRSGRLKWSGKYTVSATGGIARASDASAQLALFENPSVSAPPPKEEPVPNRGRQVQILISVLATFSLLVWGVWGARVLKRK